MLQINTETDKPPLKNLYYTIDTLCREGFRIADVPELRKAISDDVEASKYNLQNNYNIQNPNSPAQVVSALKSLNNSRVDAICTVVEKKKNKKTGQTEEVVKYSSNSKCLMQLSELGFNIADQLRVYRKASKYLGYIDKLTSLKDADGRVYPEASLGKTGRINYTNPDLMNIPKKIIWNLLLPPNDNMVLFSIDIKNQEPWILFNSLGITNLVNYIDSCGDIGLYISMFQLWFGDAPNLEELIEFKVSWNALTYGCTKKLVLDTCKTIDGEVVYQKFKAIKELTQYSKECNAKGFANVRKTYTLFGREIECDGAKGLQLAKQHMDLRIQGTGVDILAFLVLHLQKKVREEGLEEMIKIVLTRHDEVVVGVDTYLLEEYGREWVMDFLRECFEHRINDWVPFRVTIKQVETMNVTYEYDTDTEDDF